MSTDTDPDQWMSAQRTWMFGNLRRAAEHFGLTVTGDAVEGWCLRSLSVPAIGADGPRWLRVGSEFTRWVVNPETAACWTGIPDSNAIVGVPKPAVLASIEWVDQDHDPAHERRVRADVMTVMAERPCSSTDALRTRLDLPDSWWVELRHSLDAIRTTETARYANRIGRRSERVRKVFGDRVADAFQPFCWETTHGDLHWSNVCGPQLGILDWELWGPGPVGTDAATLYLFGLLVPEVANRVREVFHDSLDTAAGRIAQVGVASRILWRAQQGENTDLADAVQHYLDSAGLLEQVSA